MYFYFVSALILLVFGLIVEFIYREHLFKHLKARLVWALVFLFIGTLWDQYAIPNGHWVFTGKGILGIYVGVIPIEEFMWFLIVPYFCLTIYRAVEVDRKTR
ncbi:MAG: lycopene cyclase domain-containing protein [Candidatus Doudnabacteria bacterium]|nr:lycopene cyclase domain-containing protein [Candidatus Doudnabacteria bacterium]